MQPGRHWLDAYGRCRQATAGSWLHWICVPLVTLGLVGILWSLPVPARFVAISPAMNWGVLFLMAALVYYFIISFTLALGMVLWIAGSLAILRWLAVQAWPLLPISIVTFTAFWVFQFAVRRWHGENARFFNDLQLIMIGPVWLLSRLYRRLGIPF